MSTEGRIDIVYENGRMTGFFSEAKKAVPFVNEIVCSFPESSIPVSCITSDVIFLVFDTLSFAQELLRQLCSAYPQIRVMLFTDKHTIADFPSEFADYSYNLTGLSHPKIGLSELSFILDSISVGDSFIHILQKHSFRTMLKKEDGQPDELLGLTDREMEVLILIAEGATNRMIADVLFISENTAKTHVRRVLEKLQFSSRTKAALYAVNKGLIKNDHPKLILSEKGDY